MQSVKLQSILLTQAALQLPGFSCADIKERLTPSLWVDRKNGLWDPLDPFKVSALPSVVVGLTGLEPVTLRLSSACSNQLSYRPALLTTSLRILWVLFSVPGFGPLERAL